MFPQIKLAMLFAKIARDHGHKVLHSNNIDLLTKDLGDALKEQKNILSDARRGVTMTTFDILPLVLEVKVLTAAVAKKLDIDTKGKSDIAILDEIVAKSEERNGGKYAKGIKDSLEWTRKLFSHPDIQDMLKMDVTEIEKPSGMKGLLTFAKQITGRSQDELTRLREFMKAAKEIDDIPDPRAADKPTPKDPPAPKQP